MSVYAIGDVQGCLVSLENLLKLINYKKSDQLIFLGDIVNRGNNSLETLRFLKKLNPDVVLGNHDLHTIGVYYGVRKISESDTIANLTKSPDADSLIHWLKSKPLFLKKYDHIFVHAGMNPLWSLNQCLNHSEKISYALIKNLKKTYKNDVTALKGIDLSVEKGDFFALLGPNGAGKSTTIGIISSLVVKNEGSLKICGIDVDEDFNSAKLKLGVVNQEFNFSQFEKVFDIIVTQAGFYGVPYKVAKERTEKYLKKLGLWDKKDEQARMLSGGQKRRVMIIKALIHEPELLILDEPTAGVDIELRRILWDFLKEINKKGTTIILTTHYLEEAESLCKKIAIIDNGEIIENTSMNKLLSKLDDQFYVIETSNHIEDKFKLTNFYSEREDENKLAVKIPKDKTLNDLFAEQEIKKLKITNIKNQTNRLEELFIRLTTKND